jgi:rsbT co-antagonist protein RsbR
MLQEHQTKLLDAWQAKLKDAGGRFSQLVTEDERRRYATGLMDALVAAEAAGSLDDVQGPGFEKARQILGDVSANFAERGLTPSETATFVFALREAVFDYFPTVYTGEDALRNALAASRMIDGLGLYTFESFTVTRERLIKSQAQALADLSTPVIQIWDGIIALPLVGAIDSARAKDIMERLLEAVVAHEADIVIIDITGVPVVDTQVANRLMRTVEAVRLLGTRSIITGINPIIAQTLVQLGVDLSQLTTKASLRAGLQQAFRELKLRVRPAEAR